MRAWYVFAVIGFILSAGMLTCGYVLTHETHVQKSYPLPPNAVVISAPLSTTTPVATPTPRPAPRPALKPTVPPVITAYIVNNRPKFAIPKNYYHYPFKKCKPTYNNLIKLLDRLKCPHKYNPRKFKCSHFAAWLEWYLENHGFRTDVVVLTWKDHSNPPHISGHALDKVYTEQGVFYVDPTVLTIPGAHGRDMIVSLHSEIPTNVVLIGIHTYHNIYELKAALGYYQINWWDVLGYPPKVN